MMFIRRRVAKITNSIYHRIYLSGWGGRIMPRNIRKLIAGSQIHRAWFLGYNGYFEEDSVADGLARPYTEMLENQRNEFIEASEKYWEQIQREDDWVQELNWIAAENQINYALENQLWFDQWEDFYEYTGMADLVRESQRREKEIQGLDYNYWADR